MSLREDLLALKALRDSAGWGIFAREIQAQLDQIVMAIVTSPLETLDGALAQEFQKGAASRTTQIMALPEVLIEQLRIDIQRQENSNGTGTGNDDE